MPDTVLVADRGAAAVRVLRAVRALGLKAVSVHTAADSGALHRRVADESVLLGEDGYADVVKLVEAARQARAQVVHPAAAVVPGLREEVRTAGLDWAGEPLALPVALRTEAGLSEAATGPATSLPGLAPPAVELVTGLDVVGLSLGATDYGAPAPGGHALSIELRATSLHRVTRWLEPSQEHVRVDPAVAEGDLPTDPLLAVLSAWGATREQARARLWAAGGRFVVEGPALDLPLLLERVRPT